MRCMPTEAFQAPRRLLFATSRAGGRLCCPQVSNVEDVEQDQVGPTMDDLDLNRLRPTLRYGQFNRVICLWMHTCNVKHTRTPLCEIDVMQEPYPQCDHAGCFIFALTYCDRDIHQCFFSNDIHVYSSNPGGSWSRPSGCFKHPYRTIRSRTYPCMCGPICVFEAPQPRLFIVYGDGEAMVSDVSDVSSVHG